MIEASLSDGHRLALDQLRDLVTASAGAIDMPVEPSSADEDGWLRAQISLDTSATPRAPRGVRLHARERFILVVPPSFPFDLPLVFVPHQRWAGRPHVQWSTQLCLYAAPSVEWIPSDGMLGLVDRLTVWLERAALGELDPDDLPLHPPVAYVTRANGVIVVRPDLGSLAPESSNTGRRELGGAPGADRSPSSSVSLVVGVTEHHGNDRVDLVEWVSRQEWLRRCVDGVTPPERDGHPVAGAVAVLTDRELTFEYPKRAADLVAALENVGLAPVDLFNAIGEVAAGNHVLALRRAGMGPVVAVDLNVLVGTPSRRLDDGVLRQHLVCWRFDDFGRHQAENLIFADADDPDLARRGAEAQHWIPQWVAQAEASWVQVMEARPEVTIRRDEKSSAHWIRGKRVLVMGCGALGGPIAEFCVRGGAAVVQVVDNDLVSPGVLVRQPYSDADIGFPKSLALAARLNRLRGDSPVNPTVGSVQAVVLAEGAPPPDVDLVIDATADGAVAALLELRRSRGRASWPPCISVGIGHDARRGVATISKRGATGAGRDVLRRLALAARGHIADKLQDVAADFFPIEPRGPMFQPEPGCSTPTFTGSSAELAALAGHLFDTALGALAGSGPPEAAQPMAAAVVRLEGAPSGEMLPGVTWLGWPNDLLCDDPTGGYEIRISRPAQMQMRTEARRGARVRGPEIETGGLLLGQVDDACKCVWVDESSGPPQDSRLAATHFDHGVQGVEQLVAHHRRRSHDLMTFLGMWHIHPYGVAAPSRIDKLAMRDMVLPVVNGPRRALILILGGGEATWQGWVDGDGTPDAYAEFVTRPTDGTLQDPGPSSPRPNISGDFAGGWDFPSPPTARRSRLQFPLTLRLRRRRVHT